MAYVLLCAVRRIGPYHTTFADATCGTIRLKLLKIGALVCVTALLFKTDRMQRLSSALIANT
jgi:hypothetical protein